MPKQVKQPHPPKDVNQLAHHLVELSTSETESDPGTLPPVISQYIAAIGRKGGQIGGKRRLKTMTKDQRRKVAAKAAKARWSRKKER